LICMTIYRMKVDKIREDIYINVYTTGI